MRGLLLWHGARGENPGSHNGVVGSVFVAVAVGPVDPVPCLQWPGRQGRAVRAGFTAVGQVPPMRHRAHGETFGLHSGWGGNVFAVSTATTVDAVPCVCSGRDGRAWRCVRGCCCGTVRTVPSRVTQWQRFCRVSADCDEVHLAE